jgi:hypothetical protein
MLHTPAARQALGSAPPRWVISIESAEEFSFLKLKGFKTIARAESKSAGAELE